MKRIVAVGDNVVDCYPDRDLMFPGGCCLNVSIFARRFGADTAYVGAIGSDVAGDTIRAALAIEGVNITHLRVLPAATAYCVIGQRRNGDRVFLTYDLSISLFEPSEADFVFVGGADAVHVGQSSGLDAHLPRLAAAARLSYDFSTRREPEHRAAIAPLCFLAAFSAGDLHPSDARALIAETLAAGATWCLLTRGAAGALLGSAADLFAIAAVPTTAIDTLGAGDTFIARTLVGLLEGEDPAALLAAAAIAAADTCTRFGATGHAAKMQIDAGLIPAVVENP